MSENTTEKFIFDADYKSLFKWTEYLVKLLILRVMYIRKAKDEGVKMIFEICAHHLNGEKS